MQRHSQIAALFRLLPVSVCMFASCAVRPGPDPAQVIREGLPEVARIPAHWTAPAPGGAAVHDDWLASFDDPALDAVVREAIAYNPDLRATAERVERAREVAIQVGAQLLPAIGVSAAGSTTKVDGRPGNFRSHGGTFGASWEIDVWGRLRTERAAAEAGYYASGLEYAFARQSLAAAAARSWYQTTEALQLLELAQETVAIYQQLLALVQSKVDFGQVGKLDLVEAAARVSDAQSQTNYAESIYRESQRNLEVLIGHYPAATVRVNRSFAPVPPPVPAGLPSGLLQRRPDVAAAEQRVQAAFHDVEAAKLVLLPSFSLTGSGGRLNDQLLSLVGLNPNFYHIAIGMVAPLYEGGALRAQIKIANAEQQEALARYGEAALQALKEVETALTNEELYGNQLHFLEQALDDRTEAVRIAKLKYKAGAIDLLSVLQLQASELATQADVIKMRNARLANRIDLHLALGGSFDATPAAAYSGLPPSPAPTSTSEALAGVEGPEMPAAFTIASN